MLIVTRIFLIGLLLVFGLAFRMETLHENSSVSSPELNANSKTQILFPLPKSISTNSSSEPLSISPCNINYKIVANSSINIQKIINNYLTNVFHCSSLNPENITLYISVKDPYTMTSLKTAQEKYELMIPEKNQWTLNADTHVGFLRGFQTFSQLFEENGSDDKTYVIRGRPISISDQPDYIWRGVMLDTSRHYYPVDSILHLIDGLMYNRMSILHWHIIDEDSFPLQIPQRPELSQYGNLGGTYSKQDLLQIINYAKVRGVRVIPQFDTPAHTESWGRSEALKQIIVRCNNQYEGQFDPTLDKTYQVVQDVMQYINSTFIDNYAHFGGDQVQQQCWQQRQSIYQWMKAHNILTYKQLQIYYRQQEKKLWRTQISDTKKAIYWANEDIDLPVESDDVIHWWGVTKNVNKLAGRPNEVILSNYDITYLDIGFGGRYGTGYGTYITWRQVYSFNPKIQNVNVIGGETCMWSETADENCLDQKVWIRSCALAERVWNSNVDISKDLLNISERLISQARRMKSRGFKVSPVTVGLCEKDPSICFS